MENRCVTANNAQPRKIQLLGATLEPVYQVLEFLKPFNFRLCNPRIPAPLATLSRVTGPLSGPARPSPTRNGMFLATIDPLIAAGVVLATAATDAVYVDVYVGGGCAPSRIGGDLEQHLVSAVFIRGDPLHRKPGSMSHSRPPVPGSAPS